MSLANGLPVAQLINGGSLGDHSLIQAKLHDRNDPLHHLRKEFNIPSKGSLKNADDNQHLHDHEVSIYLCGNSLGVQPKATRAFVAAQLDMWARKGVFGHFKGGNELAPSWLKIDEEISKPMAKIVGALPEEVAIMGTLTSNLHLLMASFYRPTNDRYKIIFESKAFPSDHFAVESQITHHGRDVKDAMICIEPSEPESHWFAEEHVLEVIDEHASSTALLLLPGVQFYSGQWFDISKITSYAQSKGIVVGWDLAHAVGNVPLQLHDWNVDFAVWCNYKYMNSGPGAVGGLFVHDRLAHNLKAPLPRLQGWWGSSKASRFNMDNVYEPIPGARGFQLSNPSALDFCPVRASLSLFDRTSMNELRRKSVQLTGYLEELLLVDASSLQYKIITKADRGAQLSIKLNDGLLGHVMKLLEQAGVVVDERKPDVIRVAPAPLYNSFEDCWHFAKLFRDAVQNAAKHQS